MALTVPRVEWRIVIADLDGTAIVSVEGIASQKQVVYRLNRPAQLSFVVPSDDPRVNTLHTDGEPYISCSNRVVKGYRLESGTWTLRFVGLVMQVEDNGDAESVSTAVTAFDPQQMLYSRVARRTSSSTTGPPGELNTAVYTTVAGETIAREQVEHTITWSGGCFIETTGTFESTTPQSLTIEEGTTIGAVLETLTDTDTMDVIFDPVDATPGIFAAMSVVASRGAPQPAAVFGYGTANYAVQSIRRLLNGSELANDVRVTGDRPAAGSQWPTGAAADGTSIAKYGRYESWRAADPDITSTVFLSTLAAAELALRKQPREYMSITPFAEKAPQPFTEYFLGDTIQIWTSKNLRQAVTGSQRVYGLTLSIDDTGFEGVSEILAAVN
jgi:hypothetical protein